MEAGAIRPSSRDEHCGKSWDAQIMAELMLREASVDLQNPMRQQGTLFSGTPQV